MRSIHAWILAALACAEIAEGKTSRRRVEDIPIMFGNASWYGWFHEGRLTASGVRFHALAETAASTVLPLGSWARITNLSNGRSVVVQITDRGPFVHGRIVDVSLRVARELDMIGAGVARVRIDPLPGPPHF